MDLIARKGRQVVFCEVKARTSEVFGGPGEAVTPRKQARIRRSSARWLAEQRTKPGWRGASLVRFDVVAILGDHLEVLEGAF